MEPLSGLHHTALTVTDLDASAAWYESVLGMVERFREDSPTRRAIIYGFTDRSGLSVGLVENVGSGAIAFDHVVTGLDHLAFTVASEAAMAQWAAALDSHGVAHSGVIDIPSGQILNFKDPDGIALALFWDR